MTYTSEGYLKRAEECVRLANLTKDEMVQSAILRLRQDYLRIAESLKNFACSAMTRRV